MLILLLTLLTRISLCVSTLHTCVPNTQFMINGRLCYCNGIGRWSESSCQNIGSKDACKPGEIIWGECSQCICQENGKLLCTNTQCNENELRNKTALNTDTEQWCSPFKSYYRNCRLCVCPASGNMSEARCAIDSSCYLKGPLTLEVILKNACLPKVTYIFTCLHCLCSDDGYFVRNKCNETCRDNSEAVNKCIPRTFYRLDCNICRCPDSGIRDNNLCSKSVCNSTSRVELLESLRSRTYRCATNKFTKPRCYYCECNLQGVVNKQACLELECLIVNDYNYDSATNSCSPGEMVPACTECFCSSNGFTFLKYCTEVCTIQNKLQILDSIVQEKTNLIDRNAIKSITSFEKCEPNSVFLNENRYCICPENGYTNFRLCISTIDDTSTNKPQNSILGESYAIDYNTPCEPNKYVEFGCNSCFCMKNGQLNPKWCTYDDCKTKKVIQEIHKSRSSMASRISEICVPGSVYTVECNFCICGESGTTKDRVCTKSKCSEHQMASTNEFTCEPSIYYLLDCNVCFCPADGVKNLNKCTKNHCEGNFLRTDESCVPGVLFSDECNICVCPPNGNKVDKICTNRTCADKDTPWKKIFELSQNLYENQKAETTIRRLELCFPGEEFEVGCNVCVCSELGLREYATCTEMLCDENFQSSASPSAEEKLEKIVNTPTKRQNEHCMTVSLADSSELKQCTPGSMYIIRCRQCICPYMGNINFFCRPLPYGQYCEQAYPGFNYLPMGRRSEKENRTNITAALSFANTTLSHELVDAPHNHTFYSCETPGRVKDDCFICQCEEGRFIVEEHCFRNELDICVEASPTFLNKVNMLV